MMYGQLDKTRTCLMAVTGVFQLGGGIAAANRLAFWALKDVGYTIDILALNEINPEHDHGSGLYAVFSNHKYRFAISVWRALLSRRYTLVFCDHVNLAAIMYPLKVLARCPIIVRLNGIEVFPPFPSLEGRIGLRAATHLTAISDFTRLQVLRSNPRLEVTTVDLALDVTADQLLSDQAAPIGDIELMSIDGIIRRLRDNVLLIVGRMAFNERYKGHDILIEAMPLIVGHVAEAQLVIVGSGDDMPRLRELALSQPEHIQSQIFMPGYVDEVSLQTLYRSCALFTMPSTGEGFGLVYLEAMRWSKACLGTRHDAAATIILDGETGLLVDEPRKSAAVADAIVSLLIDSHRLERMGRQGYKRLCEYYLYEHFRDRFTSFVDDCLGNSKA